MQETKKPEAGEYTTFTSKMPEIPGRIAPYIESRRQVQELDRQLKIIRQMDNTREAFKDFF